MNDKHDQDALRHGYTLADIDQITRRATLAAGPYAASNDWLTDEAWSGVVEHLYTAEDPPSDYDLWHAGRTAIWDTIRTAQTQRGGSRHHNFEAGTSRAFHVYWWPYRAVQPSFETGLVERMALRQIWPLLTEPQREAVSAVAAAGTIERAAAALGKTPAAVSQLVVSARRTVAAAWVEGETPRRSVWQQTRRGTIRTAVATNLGGACRRGHPYDEANTYTGGDGRRRCRACAAAKGARYRRRKAAA